MSPEGIKALADILVEKSKVYALNLKEFGALNPQDQVRPTLLPQLEWNLR